MNQETSSIKDKVLSAIDSGAVTMQPKWHFVVKTALLIMGIILAALTLVYITSFIIFSLQQTGIWFTPSFGLRGLRELLLGMPWLLLLLTVIFLTILQVLVKKYSFSYAKPLFYSILSIAVVVTAAGILVSKTSIHRGLFRQANEHRLPLAGGLYRVYGLPIHGSQVTTGEITLIADKRYTIITPNNKIYEVEVTLHTRLPYGMDFDQGDRIMVIGERNGGTITAFGIVEIKNQMVIPPPEYRPHNQQLLPFQP